MAWADCQGWNGASVVAVLAALAFGGATGCRSGASGTPEWKNVVLPTGTMKSRCDAVGGVADDDVWVVGEDALHFDGKTWTKVGKGFLASSIVGRASDDVYAFGPLHNAHHWDGKTWTPVNLADPKVTGDPSITSRNIELAGSVRIGNHLFAIDRSRGWFVHDGKAWKLVQPPELAGKWNIDLWGPTPDELFVAVSQVEHAWMARCTPSGCELSPLLDHSRINAVGGTGPKDVWAAGFGGQTMGKPPLVYHFDGTSWKKVSLPDVGVRLHDLAVVRRDLAYAVGTRGFILRWNGTKWEASPSGTDRNLNGIFVPPGGGRPLALAGDCTLLEPR